MKKQYGRFTNAQLKFEKEMLIGQLRTFEDRIRIMENEAKTLDYDLDTRDIISDDHTIFCNKYSYLKNEAMSVEQNLGRLTGELEKR